MKQLFSAVLLATTIVALAPTACSGSGGSGGSTGSSTGSTATTSSTDTTTGTGGAGGCATPSIACAGACVDTSTDAKNCGACGHDCQGGMCQASVCQPVTLASDQSDPESIAVDATSVYWTNYDSSGAVMKVGSTGVIPSLSPPARASRPESRRTRRASTGRTTATAW